MDDTDELTLPKDFGNARDTTATAPNSVYAPCQTSHVNNVLAFAGVHKCLLLVQRQFKTHTKVLLQSNRSLRLHAPVRQSCYSSHIVHP